MVEDFNAHIVQPVSVSDTRFGTPQSIAHLTIEANSRLNRTTIADISSEEDLTVLLHIREGEAHIPPEPACVLAPGDEIVILASEEKLRGLEIC